MGLGDVTGAVVPKMSLLSPARHGGCVNTHTLIPHKCHTSIGVLGAVSVATGCVLPGTVAHPLSVLPAGKAKVLDVEHPTGKFRVRLEVGGTEDAPTVDRSGLIRTARALFDGVVYPRAKPVATESVTE